MTSSNQDKANNGPVFSSQSLHSRCRSRQLYPRRGLAEYAQRHPQQNHSATGSASWGFPPAAHHAAYYRDAGRTEYYEKARCLLEDLEEIDASFNTARNKPKGHLRIAIGGSTACDVLIPLLADFMTSWPDIRIDLQVADKPADLISGNIDCAIRGGPMEDSTLIARKIGEATLVTCATPGYLQRYGTPPRRMNYIMATGSSAICRRPAAERFRFALRVTASAPS